MKFVLTFVLVASVALGVAAQQTPLEAVKANLSTIQAEAQEVLRHNETLKPKSRLGAWVISAQNDILAAAAAALEAAQRIVIQGTGVTPPSGGFAITPNVSSAGCSKAEVAALFAAVGTTTNQVIGIGNDGSPCHWTSPGLDWNAPEGTIIIGEGLANVVGGDGPTIVDDIQANDPVLNIGAKSTGVLRIMNLTVIGGIHNVNVERHGIFAIYSTDGALASVRWDHNTLDTQTYSPALSTSQALFIGNYITGVADNNKIKNFSGSATYTFNGAGSDGAGNAAWSAPVAYTTDKADGFFFFEDNEYWATTAGPTRIVDAFSASKIYMRYNDIYGSNGPEMHAVGHSGDDRGPRGTVFEGNRFRELPGQSVTPSYFVDASSGEYLIWGNSVDSSAAMSGGITTNITRKDHTTYHGASALPAPDNLAHCSGSFAVGTPYTGIVNVASDGLTLTYVSGHNFNTGWRPAVGDTDGTMIYVAKTYTIDSVASATSLTLQGAGAGGIHTKVGYHVPGQAAGYITIASDGVTVTYNAGTQFNVGWTAGTSIKIGGYTRVASVGSTTSLTLKAVDMHDGFAGVGGIMTGATYVVGSPWDGGGTDGYPCLDQPGRGEGDLLSGYLPSKLNVDNGSVATWPRQLLMPIYEWMNTLQLGANPRHDDRSFGRVLANRDIFFQASAINASAGSPFTGASGTTGWGPIGNRLSTCTFDEATGAGPAYFATDEGSWNSSVSNPLGVNRAGADGRLYKCTADDTWTLFFTPATYPHPLRTTP